MPGPNAISVGSPDLRLPRRQPTVAFEVLIIAAWVAVLVWSLTGSGEGSSAPGMGSMAGMGSMPGMSGMAHAAVTRTAMLALPMWVVMATAMMLPAALPAMRRLAAQSAPRRRAPAMTVFAAVFVGVWAIFGVAALLVSSAVHAPAGIEVGIALAVAVAWQLTIYKRHALSDCHRAVVLQQRGRPRPAGAARFGLVNAGACVRSCWPAMLAMAFIPGPQMWIWMPALSALMWGERFARRPRPASRLVAVALGVAAIVALAFV
jgi:predicted metal-binding membrane protein